MAAESSSAAAAIPNHILADDRVYICKDQFDDKSKELLAASAKALGAAMATSDTESTVILTNPAASGYKADFTAFQAQPGLAEKCLPYHWIANCRINHARLSLSGLPSPMPLFINPVPSKSHAPVKVWVSINVVKRSNEMPHVAQQNVSDDMEANGALLVSKRSQADVLIVDRTTKFYATIREEIRVRGRKDQIVAEREWVDDCVKRRQLSWKVDDSHATQPTQEADRDSDQDSFVAEDPRPAGKGPGRPTGQPRVDYSPQDDDFLCRYLAHTGSSSFGSRKTYQTMVAAAEQYPIASRHSAQSWHERFKKNSNSFFARLQRFRQAGIDGTLKTAEERAKAAAIAVTPPRRAAEAPVSASPSQAAVPARQPTNSTKKSRLDARSVPAPMPGSTQVVEPGPEVPSSSAKNLVELESESEPSQLPTSTAPPINIQPEAVMQAEPPAPAPDVDVVMEETVNTETVIPAAPPPIAPNESFDDRMAIDDVLGESQSQPHIPESGSTNHSNGHDVGVAETQALLSDFARAKAAARAANATPPPAASPRQRPRGQEAEAARSPRRRDGPPSPYLPQQIRSPVRPSTALRPAADTFLLRSPDRGAGHRTAMPAVVHVELQAVEIGGNLIDIQPQTGTPKRKSLLQRELEASSGRRAARRSVARESSPDRVYATARLPPARSSPYARSSSSPGPDAPRRARSPPLSRIERERRISQGADVADAYRNEYRTNMLRLSRTYNLLPKELGRLMAEFRKRGVTGWVGVEQELAKMRREAESDFDDDV